MIEEFDLHRVHWCVLGLLLHEFDAHPSASFVPIRQLIRDVSYGPSDNTVQIVAGELVEWELVSEEIVPPDEPDLSAEPYYGITPKGANYVLSNWDSLFDNQFTPLGDFPDKICDNVARILRLDEDLPGDKIPGSDRYVALDHNSAEYQRAKQTVEDLIEAVRAENEYAEAAPDEREGVIATLKHGLEVLNDRVADVEVLRATLVRTARYLANKFGDAVIGAAAAACLTAVAKLLGIF